MHGLANLEFIDQRMVVCTGNTHTAMTDAPVHREILGEQLMDILDVADRQGLQVVGIIKNEPQGILVVEQHDGFFLGLAISSLTLAEQTLGLQQLIGIAFNL